MRPDYRRRVRRNLMLKTRVQVIERFNEGVGVTHPGQGPACLAQTLEILSRKSKTRLAEQLRERLDLFDALAALMRIVVAAVILEQSLRGAAEFSPGDAFQFAADGFAWLESERHASV